MKPSRYVLASAFLLLAASPAFAVGVCESQKLAEGTETDVTGLITEMYTIEDDAQTTELVLEDAACRISVYIAEPGECVISGTASAHGIIAWGLGTMLNATSVTCE